MTLHVFDDVVQGSEEWHSLRRGMVTASAVGKLITPTLKVADNDVSRGLTALLVAERVAGFTEPTFTNDDMMRGVLNEPIARDLYSGHYQQAVECGFMRFDGDGWQLGFSPDGLVADEGLIEIKSPRARTHLRTIIANEVPAQYIAQCQAGLLVSGRKWLDFVSFVSGMPLFVRRVYPDKDWHAAIKAACIEFEKNARAMADDYERLAKCFPKTERIDLDLVI